MLDVIFNHVEIFILVLIRMSSFFYITPVFGFRNVPMMVKTGLVFCMALILTPIIAATSTGALYQGLPFADLFLVVLKEFMVGVILGLTATTIFAAVQVGGSFIDLQIGFSMANVVDPMSGTSSPLTGQFKYVLAMLLFLGIDGHHGLLTALMQSYQFIPVGGFQISDHMMSFIMQTFSVMFLLGVKVAIPIIAALFLSDFGLAMLSRAVPQMNVFVIGMPIKVVVGIVMLVVVMPAFVYLLRGLFDTMFTQMDTLLRMMGG
jgi:flagellar biosynthetic protein FliR